jgi:dihydroorotate dehydrogenase (NAD+) catalytic subunit
MLDLAPSSSYGLRLANPVLTAAGCFGFGVEYARSVPIERLGAIVTRSVTMRGRRPQHPPRLLETPAGLVSIGAAYDPGLERVLETYLETWLGWKTPVILSIAADYVDIATALETVEGIAALELRLDDPQTAAETVAAVRALSLLPLLAKLPLHDGLPETAHAVVAAGADALTLSFWPAAATPHPSTGVLLDGRLSGPALRPLALHALARVAAVVQCPLIAGGGIRTADHTRQFLAAGATAVQVGSALVADPLAAVRIADQLHADGANHAEPQTADS